MHLHREYFENARTPSVPCSLDLTLEEYFAAAALVGLTSAQEVEPDQEWVAEWSLTMGARMAAKARELRKK